MSEHSFFGDLCTFLSRLDNVTNGCVGGDDFPRKTKNRKNLYICVVVATTIIIIGLGVGLGLQKSEQGKMSYLHCK